MLLESVPNAVLTLAGRELESNPSAVAHRSINTGQAYNFDLAIWGPGNVSAYSKEDLGETPDLNNITRTPLHNTFEGIHPQSEEKILTEPKSGTIRQIADRLQNPDGELSGDDKATLERLKRRDSRVRAHENAHKSAGGGVVIGGASYTYQRGPDGKMYAIGGSVMIDTSPVYGNPEATIRKMQQVRAAALAPADPSAADVRVAANASSMELAARAELTQMLVESRKQIQEGLTPGRRAIAMEYAEQTQATDLDSNAAKTGANKSSEPALPQRTQTPQTLERQRAKNVALSYQQARLEAPPDVTDSLIG